MKKISWEVKLGLWLVLASVVLHCAHYLIFRDWHHVFIYLFGDIAFLPVEVLFVVLIIERLMTRREKLLMMDKLNMVINTFFSETGTRLLKLLISFDAELGSRQKYLKLQNSWTTKEFQAAHRLLEKSAFAIDIHRGQLENLHLFLQKEKDFLVRLLENPILLEHQTFTEMLWAVFHLEDELAWRESLKNLPETDCEHLANDIQRAYRLVLREWLSFLQHLQHSYPFLFSLAVRTNPFNPEASPVVK
ncbi:MAG TPA: hypothetical protein PKX93_02910 [bacterium]|nr:hypothetical protein [bacterium]HOL66391.1 hypothetical protein [bacterium]HPP12611.1 hypothetical protein [bacterium]